MFELKDVYKASILAKRVLGASDPDEDDEVQHQPFIIHAESMQAAERDAESLAFEKWKKEDGWQRHEAYIAPATREDLKVISGIEYRGPIFQRPDEEPKTVKFGW